MGGNAFLEDGLYTPRMPTSVYQHILQQVENKLSNHFTFVDHPKEAPGKTSHGDLDVLICQSKSQDPVSGDFLARILGASTWKRTPGNSEIHLALPWPEQDLGSDKASVRDLEKTVQGLRVGNNTHTDETSPMVHKQKYVQADIRLCSTHQTFQWYLFQHAHGDFWAVMGSTIRRLGLTISDKGLMVRIAEVEPHNRQAARVKLTDDPNTILHFLGLDVDRFWGSFTDYEAIMDYAATCRFHDPARWKDKAESDRKGDMMDGRESRRVAKRPMFAYWIETYLPAHIDDKPDRRSQMSRDDVILDASTIPDIGQDFLARFITRKEEWTKKLGQEKLWVDIRKFLPEANCQVGYAMKGMKREITTQEEEPSVIGQDLARVREAYQQNNFDVVLDWARQNWEAVGQRQEALDRERSKQKLRDKMAKADRINNCNAHQTIVVNVGTIITEVDEKH